MQPTHFEFQRYLAFDGKVAFRYPVPTREPPISHTTNTDRELVGIECQTIRPSFYNLLHKHLLQIEKEYLVKCFLKKLDKNVSLRITGKDSYQAMQHSLQLCLDSKVYNFYLCLPVKGRAFDMELEEFRAKYEDNFVGAKWESRPHVTLKMLNIVTNNHLDSIINSLCAKSRDLQRNAVLIEPVSLELSPFDIFGERGKNADLPIFAHAKLNNLISDVSKQLIEIVSQKYSFKNDLVKQYISGNENDDQDEMCMENGSLYVHSYNAKNDLVASGQSKLSDTDITNDNKLCHIEQKSGDNESGLSTPHVTLIRFKNYKEVVGLHGPKTALVSTFELRPRHDETTWPYELFANDNLAFSYNLLPQNDRNQDI